MGELTDIAEPIDVTCSEPIIGARRNPQPIAWMGGSAELDDGREVRFGFELDPAELDLTIAMLRDCREWISGVQRLKLGREYRRRQRARAKRR